MTAPTSTLIQKRPDGSEDRNFLQRWHEPMQQFLATQGAYVKSFWIIDAWITKYPKFMDGANRSAKQQTVGRILGDLLQKYTRTRKSGGCRTGSVFINIYSQKQGISIADVAE